MRDDLTARVEAGVFCVRDAEDFYAEAAAAMGLDAPGVPQAARDFVRRLASERAGDFGTHHHAFQDAWYAYQDYAEGVLAVVRGCRS